MWSLNSCSACLCQIFSHPFYPHCHTCVRVAWAEWPQLLVRSRNAFDSDIKKNCLMLQFLSMMTQPVWTVAALWVGPSRSSDNWSLLPWKTDTITCSSWVHITLWCPMRFIPGYYKPVSLTSLPGKIVEGVILGVIEKNLRDNTDVGHSQHGFKRGKSCLTNFIFFYDKVIYLVD